MISDAAEAMLLQAVASALSTQTPARLAVAVSGGGDSMALLHLVRMACDGSGTQVLAVTVDHGLRDESASEALMVAAYCKTLGIAHDTLTWQGWDGSGNLQARARDARYALIADWAKDKGVATVALGHTQDDVAETFLMRLARKAGVDGLAAMAPDFERLGVAWVRPLLHCARSDLRSYLTQHDIPYVDDPSNDDSRYERVRVRNALASVSELGLDSAGLAAVAQAQRSARAALEHYTMVEAKRIVTEDRGDILLQMNPDPAVPADMMRRLLTAAVQFVGRGSYGPRADALDHLETALAGGAARHTIAGCLVARHGSGLRIAREPNAVRDLTVLTTEIWDGRWQLKGAHAPDLDIRALGDGILDCPDWRETGLPRASLMASPAVWRGQTLVAAPIAGFNPLWTAQTVADLNTFLLSH